MCDFIRKEYGISQEKICFSDYQNLCCFSLVRFDYGLLDLDNKDWFPPMDENRQLFKTYIQYCLSHHDNIANTNSTSTTTTTTTTTGTSTTTNGEENDNNEESAANDLQNILQSTQATSSNKKVGELN